MSRPPRLVVLDTVMVDVLMRIDTLPARGGDTRARQLLVSAGGGLNALTAAARHGLEVLYLGQLGTGPFAQVARTALATASISAPVPANPSVDLGICLVLVDAAGERTFVTAPGAELTLTRADLDLVEVGDGDIVFLSGYDLVYPEIGAMVAGWLDDLADEVVVAFDPGPRVTDIPDDLLARALNRTDWLLCNATEAGALSAHATLAEASTDLLARTGARGVVIHDGARGCVVTTPTVAPVRVAAVHAEVLDTNGAGDTHDGVFLAEVALGTDPVEAARRANAAAAIAIGRLGSATSPSRAEVASWFAAFPADGPRLEGGAP
jgi:sugar/nucleoside kinase (ribokinase family)